MPFRRRHALAAVAALLASPTFAQDRLKVAAIYTVPVEQQWVSRIDKALKAAAARGEIDYTYKENVAPADFERVLRELAESGPRLIVGESFAVEAAARKVARAYPKTAFLMGSGGRPQAPNFSVFDNYIQEAAYLTGMLAGGMTQSGRIGLVGGYPVPEVNRLMNAFIAGAREVNPKAKFSIAFINRSFDPPKAKQAAYAMVDDGVDVLYAERFGVSEAAQERKVLAIGNVINTQDKYPDTVLASALWHVEPTLDAAFKAVRAGRFKAEDYGRHSQMRAGGSELSALGTFEGKVPAELMARVRAREAAIRSGKFVVKVNDTRPR